MKTCAVSLHFDFKANRRDQRKLVGAFERLCPWQARLGLRPDLHEAVAGLDAGQRRLVELRYGLCGGKPLTFVELAELTEATPSNVARRIARAEAMLRQIRRSVI